jgi:hypothetical protein
LIGSSDEFLYYDDLIREREKAPKPRKTSEKTPAAKRRQEATEKIAEIVRSLERDYDTVWGSMVKQTIRRVFPSFNEEYFGYRSFAEVLESVEKAGDIELEYDEARGNYVVRSRRT